MITYLLGFGIILGVMLAYLWLARKYHIVDMPKKRSSHKLPTLSGGGILFPIAVLYWFFAFEFQKPLVVSGLLVVSVVSIIDDVSRVSYKIRLIFHVAVVSLLFWQAELFGESWYIWATAYIFTIGWINAFNFMDGINGISGGYSLVSLLTFLFLNHQRPFTSEELLIVMLIAVVVFLFFNARKKAIVFAGDVGSISLAFILAWFIIKLIVVYSKLFYILLFSVYAIDSVITIVYRIKRRENILKPHRTHLYQYLANEMGWPHLRVSALYAGVQLIINVIGIYLIQTGIMTWGLFAFLAILMIVVYLAIRFHVIKLAVTKTSNI